MITIIITNPQTNNDEYHKFDRTSPFIGGINNFISSEHRINSQNYDNIIRFINFNNTGDLDIKFSNQNEYFNMSKLLDREPHPDIYFFKYKIEEEWAKHHNNYNNVLVEYTYDEFDEICRPFRPSIPPRYTPEGQFEKPEIRKSRKIDFEQMFSMPYPPIDLKPKITEPEYTFPEFRIIGSEYYFGLYYNDHELVLKHRNIKSTFVSYEIVLDRLLSQPYYFNRFIVNKQGIIGFKRTLRSVCSSTIYVEDVFFSNIKYLLSLSALSKKGIKVQVNEYKIDINKLNSLNVSNFYGLSIESILLLDGKYNTYRNIETWGHGLIQADDDKIHFEAIFKAYGIPYDEVINKYGDFIITI